MERCVRTYVHDTTAEHYACIARCASSRRTIRARATCGASWRATLLPRARHYAGIDNGEVVNAFSDHCAIYGLYAARERPPPPSFPARSPRRPRTSTRVHSRPPRSSQIRTPERRRGAREMINSHESSQSRRPRGSSVARVPAYEYNGASRRREKEDGSGSRKLDAIVKGTRDT